MTSSDTPYDKEYTRFEAFTATVHNEIFSGGQPCQCGDGVRHFRDCLCLRHERWVL
jgi:hypothetical protein